MRLIWRFEDILLDYPKALNVLAQSIAYLSLRAMIPGRIITQIPEELRAKLLNVEAFSQTFQKEIVALKTESEYRAIIKDLLHEFYTCFDD